MNNALNQIVDELNKYNSNNTFEALITNDEVDKKLNSSIPLILLELESTKNIGKSEFVNNAGEHKIVIKNLDYFTVDIISDQLDLLEQALNRFNLIMRKKLSFYPLSFQNISIAEERKHRFRGRFGYTYDIISDPLDPDATIGIDDIELYEA